MWTTGDGCGDSSKSQGHAVLHHVERLTEVTEDFTSGLLRHIIIDFALQLGKDCGLVKALQLAGAHGFKWQYSPLNDVL